MFKKRKRIEYPVITRKECHEETICHRCDLDEERRMEIAYGRSAGEQEPDTFVLASWTMSTPGRKKDYLTLPSSEEFRVLLNLMKAVEQELDARLKGVGG